jgi:hypothetical protein
MVVEEEWDSNYELTYHKTCCGQTITKSPRFLDIYTEEPTKYCGNNEILEHHMKKCHYFINEQANMLGYRLIELRDPPIRHPESDTILYNIEFTPDEFLTRKKEWEEESLGVLNKAPRTYIDMVVSTPVENKRILFKIIDGFKCDILIEHLSLTEEKVSYRTLVSGLEKHSYKQLFEHYDLDNPFIISRLHKEGLIEDDFSCLKHTLLYKYSWYHKNLVKSVNKEVDNIPIYYNDLDSECFKDYLNLNNLNILDVESGQIVNEKLSAEFEEKVQFALTMAWLLSSNFDNPHLLKRESQRKWTMHDLIDIVEKMMKRVDIS